MARRHDERVNGDASDEVDRYREAAEAALEQLDWAIGYLHRIRKTGVARGLAKNRAFIRRQLMD